MLLFIYEFLNFSRLLVGVYVVKTTQKLTPLNHLIQMKHNTVRNDAEEQSQIRLAKLKERAQVSRMNQTEEQRQKRLEKQKNRSQSKRATDTQEQRQSRLEKNREQNRSDRSNETEEQRQSRLEKNREQNRSSPNERDGRTTSDSTPAAKEAKPSKQSEENT